MLYLRRETEVIEEHDMNDLTKKIENQDKKIEMMNNAMKDIIYEGGE